MGLALSRDRIPCGPLSTARNRLWRRSSAGVPTSVKEGRILAGPILHRRPVDTRVPQKDPELVKRAIVPDVSRLRRIPRRWASRSPTPAVDSRSITATDVCCVARLLEPLDDEWRESNPHFSLPKRKPGMIQDFLTGFVDSNKNERWGGLDRRYVTPIDPCWFPTTAEIVSGKSGTRDKETQIATD